MTRKKVCVLLIVVLVVVSGCSQMEPKTGTRVIFDFQRKSPSREQVASVSRYLLRRARLALNAPRARVERVTASSLFLLLPGKSVSREEAKALIQAPSLEFYHLKSVATRGNPDRPWELREPASRDAPYIFVGPDAQRIDSKDPSDDLLREIAGYPNEKPLLSGRDLVPPASTAQSKRDYVVLVHFKPDAARRFRDFTTKHPGEYIGVFYNGRLLSAPMIDKPILKGEAYITGFRSLQEAQSAASQLNSGVLPLKLTIRSVARY